RGESELTNLIIEQNSRATSNLWQNRCCWKCWKKSLPNGLKKLRRKFSDRLKSKMRAAVAHAARKNSDIRNSQLFIVLLTTLASCGKPVRSPAFRRKRQVSRNGSASDASA